MFFIIHHNEYYIEKMYLKIYSCIRYVKILNSLNDRYEMNAPLDYLKLELYAAIVQFRATIILITSVYYCRF